MFDRDHPSDQWIAWALHASLNHTHISSTGKPRSPCWVWCVDEAAVRSTRLGHDKQHRRGRRPLCGVSRRGRVAACRFLPLHLLIPTRASRLFCAVRPSLANGAFFFFCASHPSSPSLRAAVWSEGPRCLFHPQLLEWALGCSVVPLAVVDCSSHTVVSSGQIWGLAAFLGPCGPLDACLCLRRALASRRYFSWGAVGIADFDY